MKVIRPIAVVAGLLAFTAAFAEPAPEFETESRVEAAGAEQPTRPPGAAAPLPPASILDLPLPVPTPAMGAGGVPGLGVPPGTPASPDPLVINVTPGVTEVVPVSNRMPNRIATPFKNPKVVDASSAQIQTIGNNVFVVPKDDTPFGIFITDETPGKPVAALTLVPKAVVSQNILLQLDRAARQWQTPFPQERTQSGGESHDELLISILRSAALGKIPAGFVQAKINVPRIAIGPVVANPDLRWSSVEMEIYRYGMKNEGDQPIELSEPSFYEKGVLAVGFFPKVRLAPGEETSVFIVATSARETGAGTAQVLGMTYAH